MKNSYIIWVLIFMFFAGCSVDQDYVFDESAVTRAQKVLKECAEVLVKPEHGWKMVFIPEAETHGGYNVLMKFLDKEQVEMYTDFLEEKSRSTYSLNSSQGPVLNFDTKSCLHYLADPSLRPYGTGLKGEFEFVIHEIHADSLVFYGKKYNNRIVFYPAEQLDWTENMDIFRANIERMVPQENAPFFRGLYMNTTAINLIYNPDTRCISYSYSDDVSKEIVSKQTSVFGTVDGVAFEPKIRVNGVVLSDLKYNDQSGTFESNTPGVVGDLSYSHTPPFVFYNSITNIAKGSTYAGLTPIGKIDPSAGMGVILELMKVFANKANMSAELKDGYQAMALAGMKEIQLTWKLDVDGEDKGPWLTIKGAKNILGESEYEVHYELLADTLRKDDQIRFRLGNLIQTNDYDFQANMEKQPGFFAFRNFFTDPAGFTIVPAANEQYYFVNLDDSRRWILLNKR